MVSDRVVGGLILIVSLAVMAGYVYWMFFTPFEWQMWAIRLTLAAGVLAFMFIVAWIGWTMLTTPPAPPIEEIISTEEEKKEEKS